MRFQSAYHLKDMNTSETKLRFLGCIENNIMETIKFIIYALSCALRPGPLDEAASAEQDAEFPR